MYVMEIIPPLVESELHDRKLPILLWNTVYVDWNILTDQGTTPLLSKYWMPLTEFTNLAMEGLKRGDLSIVVGDVIIKMFEKFEKEKAETVAQGAAALREMMK